MGLGHPKSSSAPCLVVGLPWAGPGIPMSCTRGVYPCQEGGGLAHPVLAHAPAALLLLRGCQATEARLGSSLMVTWLYPTGTQHWYTWSNPRKAHVKTRGPWRFRLAQAH